MFVYYYIKCTGFHDESTQINKIVKKKNYIPKFGRMDDNRDAVKIRVYRFKK